MTSFTTGFTANGFTVTAVLYGGFSTDGVHPLLSTQ
jgi:hypothetical protein